MKTAIVVASLFGVVAAYVSITRLTSASSAEIHFTTPSGPPRHLTSVSPREVQDSVDWRIISPTRPTIRAELKSSVLSVRSYFDSARLERMSGTGHVVCGNFGAPALADNGAFRSWVYTIARPTVGPCGGSGGGTFSAVGVKGAAEFRSQEVP